MCTLLCSEKNGLLAFVFILKFKYCAYTISGHEFLSVSRELRGKHLFHFPRRLKIFGYEGGNAYILIV